MPLHLGLRGKLLIGTTALIAAMGGMAVAVVRMVMADRLLAELQKRGVAIAMDLGLEAVGPLLTESFIDLQLLVRDRLKILEDVDYILIVDDRGTTRAHTFPGGIPQGIKDANNAGPGERYNIRHLYIDSREVYDIAVPIMDGVLGVTRVGMEARPIRKSVAASVEAMVWLIFSILAAGWLAATALVTLVTKPLQALTRATDEAGRGNLDATVPVSGKDEVGRLGEAFNRMLGDLSRDRNERERMQEALRAGEERYRLLFNSASDALLVSGVTGKGTPERFLEVNNVACAMLGYSRDELLAMAPGDVEEPGSPARLLDVAGTFAGDYQLIYETALRTRNGRSIPVEISAHLFDLQGRRAVLSVCRDITERKKSETELKAIRESLERQIRELKMLDSIKDEIIRDVSHELKSPVAKFSMQLELLIGMLSSGAPRNEIDRVFSAIKDAVFRQERTIRSILDLSRLEAGGRKYRREPVRLDLAVMEAVEDYRQVMESKGIKLVCPLRPLEITSDGEMLGHVLSNLIGNAVKFMKPQGEKWLRVSLNRKENNVELRVSDNGLGMDGNDLKRAFERFYRGNTRVEGTGLGLSICKTIVEGLKGRIWLESEGKEKGTTAVVVLPIN